MVFLLKKIKIRLLYRPSMLRIEVVDVKSISDTLTSDLLLLNEIKATNRRMQSRISEGGNDLSDETGLFIQ